MAEQKMRFTKEEVEVLKGAFAGNERLLKLLRKVFLPEYEYDAPLGQVVDLWMSVPVEGLTPEEAIIKLTARNQLIMHTEQQILQLHALVNAEELSPEELAKRAAKNSAE